MCVVGQAAPDVGWAGIWLGPEGSRLVGAHRGIVGAVGRDMRKAGAATSEARWPGCHGDVEGRPSPAPSFLTGSSQLTLFWPRAAMAGYCRAQGVSARNAREIPVSSHLTVD